MNSRPLLSGKKISKSDLEHYLVATEHLPTEAPDVELEQVHGNTIHSREDLAKLHNKDHEGLTGTAVRTTYTRGKCPPDDDNMHMTYIFKDKKGNVVGYLYDGQHTTDRREGRDINHPVQEQIANS